jgi:hypothetical protein
VTSSQVYRHDTFVATGKQLVVYNRNRVVRTYLHHEAVVRGLAMVGNLLLSYDTDNVVWVSTDMLPNKLQ